ncbi:hypothetical protein [Pseudomonas phage D6]|nr:hypothetical protein [Pseudomonas phage D6]
MKKFVSRYFAVPVFALYFLYLYYVGDIATWLIPVPGDPKRGIFCTVSVLVIAFVAMAAIFYPAIERGKRRFCLQGVSLTHHAYSYVIQPYMEKFIFDDIEWVVPAKNTTFWIDLEDTDDTKTEEYGASLVCRPKLLTSLDKTEQFDEQDLIKVVINDKGEAFVVYRGPSYVTAELHWNLSEVLEK